jgi:type 1 glutamine amidotransferase
MTRVLFLYGGWPGHFPYEVADWARGVMAELDFDVEEIQDPHRLEGDLTVYDLIVLGWTQALTTEDLSDKAEQRLVEAVRSGTGVAGWHGMTASFRASLPYQFIVGAAFVEHPGGEGVRVPYDVEIVDREHPVTRGVNDFRVASEQYYMLVDPAVHVLATTTFTGEHLPWLDGIVMPAAYVKQFGEGRVFYVSPGHEPDELAAPDMTRLVRQGMRWAARNQAQPTAPEHGRA